MVIDAIIIIILHQDNSCLSLRFLAYSGRIKLRPKCLQIYVMKKLLNLVIAGINTNLQLSYSLYSAGPHSIIYYCTIFYVRGVQKNIEFSK